VRGSKCHTIKCVSIRNLQKCWHGPSLVYNALVSGHGLFSLFERYTFRAGGHGDGGKGQSKDFEMIHGGTMNLHGHRALITGAGQGIGRACAEVFASREADLVLLDKNAETLEEVVKATSRLGVEVTPVVLDLTDLEALPKELAKVQAGGLVDILVNNAGFDRPGTLSKINRQGFESVLASISPCPCCSCNAYCRQ
jgi:hypothetical protein